MRSMLDSGVAMLPGHIEGLMLDAITAALAGKPWLPAVPAAA
jgi:hypothetical protein